MRCLCGGQAVSPVIFLSRYYRPPGPVVPLGRVLQIHRESRLYRDEDRLYRCSAKNTVKVGNVGDYLRELLPPTTPTFDLSHSTINALQALLPDLSL